jgi:hypothetical protein
MILRKFGYHWVRGKTSDVYSVFSVCNRLPFFKLIDVSLSDLLKVEVVILLGLLFFAC